MTGLARRMFGTFSAFFCLRAVGVEIDFVRLLWIMCAIEAIGMIPLPLSGWGLPQVGFVVLLGAVGVSADKSVAAEVVGKIALLPMYLTGAGILLGESMVARAASAPSGKTLREPADD